MTADANARALANVARLVVAAGRHRQSTVSLVELRIAMDGVDLEQAARLPRSDTPANIPGVRSHTRVQA